MKPISKTMSISGNTGIVPFNETQTEMFKGDRWILKSPGFLKARYDWTVSMHRVVDVLIKEIDQIDPDAKDFGIQFVPVDDIIKAAGKTGGAYREIVEDAIEQLRANEIGVWWEMVPEEIQEKDGVSVMKAHNDQGVHITTRVFMTCDSLLGREIKRLKRLRDLGIDTSDLENDRRYLMARFNTDMAPVILGLRAAIAYQEPEVLPYQSPYPVRMMHRLLAWYRPDRVTEWRVSIGELRSVMMLENKYERFADFNRRVLKQAKREINNNPGSKLKVEYECFPKSRNKPTQYVVWTIYPNHMAPDHLMSTKKEGKKPAVPARDPNQGSIYAGILAWFDSLPEGERLEVWDKVLMDVPAYERKVLTKDPDSIMARTVLGEALTVLKDA